MATRKRGYKSLKESSPTSYSQSSVSEIEPPLKRRRLSFGNLSQNNNNNNANNHRQNYLTNNLIKLRNDTKISDVTFILTETLPTPNNNNNTNNNHNNNHQSLSDDEQSIGNTRIRKFHCIKALFAANSEVFKNLLYGDFNEAKSRNPEIEIRDITCSAFEYIRDLFYHFNPQLTSDIVLDVSIAAQRYFIDELMIECINYLRNLSNITKWYNILYEIQNKYNNYFGIEQYLCALIDENYMVNNCTQIIFSDLNRLYLLNIQILSRIIKSSNIYLSEELIWHKCIGYSLYKTKLKFNINTNIKIPKKIKLLLHKHLTIPKDIYNTIKKNTKSNDKQERESKSNDNTTPKNNIKNWERMIIGECDIYILNSKKTNGDIIIDSDIEDEDEDIDTNYEHEYDEKDTEQDNNIKFCEMFENIMLKLSQNIRFTLMLPMFFIKLVQYSNILPLKRIVNIQNYSLCGINQNNNLITIKREKKYLKYFNDIQLNGNNIKNKKNKCKINNNSNKNNKSTRKSKFKSISESEEQKQDDNGDDIFYNDVFYNDENDIFYNDEMCFNGLKFNNLCIDDHIDHRDNVGRFATAVIVDIDSDRNKVKLHYIGWQSKWDLWCDVSAPCQQIRFCVAGSISTRQIHRSEFRGKGNKELKDINVKCRLAKYWYRNHPDVSDYDINEWRIASIKRIDKHSGQTQLVVKIGQKDYLWWVHLDSCEEVQPINQNNIDLCGR